MGKWKQIVIGLNNTFKVHDFDWSFTEYECFVLHWLSQQIREQKKKLIQGIG